MVHCQRKQTGLALPAEVLGCSASIGCLQAKRANIAIAMVTNPRVLFLDEPTSGLDSYTSNEVGLPVSFHCLTLAIYSPASSCLQCTHCNARNVMHV